MESQFQNLKNLDKTPEFVSTQRLVFFRDGHSVEQYFRFVGPHFIDAVFVSADGKYPQDPILNKKAFETLEKNPEAIVIVFNSDAFSRRPRVTDRILLLDSLMMNAYRYYGPHEEYRIDLTAPQLCKIMSNFFSQWDNIATETNFSLNYGTWTSYTAPKEFDWRFEMMGLSPRRIVSDDVVMFETIFHRVKGFLNSQLGTALPPELEHVEQEFATNFDYYRDRYYSFNHRRLMVGTLCARIVADELLLRCFYFESAFNDPNNYKSGFEALMRAFPNVRVVIAYIPTHQQALFQSMGFTVAGTTPVHTLKVTKHIELTV